MKTLVAFLTLICCSAFAQTNLISTNVIGTNAIAHKQKVIVTKEVVLQGLTTLSNQVVTLRAKKSKFEKAAFDEHNIIVAEWTLKHTTYAQEQDAQRAINAKYNPTIEMLEQQIGEISLQEMKIRQHYAQLLK